MEVRAYRPWPGNAAGHSGVRFVWNLKAQGRLESIETFSAKKEGDIFTKVLPCSRAQFSQFEEIPGRLALPKRILVESYASVPKSRDPEVLKTSGVRLLPEEIFQTRTIEIVVSRMSAVPPEFVRRFEPVFPPGVNVFDERTNASYTVGKPLNIRSDK